MPKGVPLPRRERIAYIARYRTMVFQADWWRRCLESLVGDGPPEPCSAPEIGGELLRHDEIPDPPALREVGWRTR